MTQTIRHQRVVKNMRKCKTMKEAMIKADYSPSYANASTTMKETKGFKEESKPILERYLKEEQRLMFAMENKDLSKEEYRTLSNSIDTIRKQIQLLSGERTGNESFVVNVLNYGSKGNNNPI